MTVKEKRDEIIKNIDDAIKDKRKLYVFIANEKGEQITSTDLALGFNFLEIKGLISLMGTSRREEVNESMSLPKMK